MKCIFFHSFYWKVSLHFFNMFCFFVYLITFNNNTLITTSGCKMNENIRNEVKSNGIEFHTKFNEKKINWTDIKEICIGKITEKLALPFNIHFYYRKSNLTKEYQSFFSNDYNNFPKRWRWLSGVRPTCNRCKYLFLWWRKMS